jgi:hypothetical protein
MGGTQKPDFRLYRKHENNDYHGLVAGIFNRNLKNHCNIPLYYIISLSLQWSLIYRHKIENNSLLE